MPFCMLLIPSVTTADPIVDSLLKGMFPRDIHVTKKLYLHVEIQKEN